MHDIPRLVLIEDNETDAEMIKRELDQIFGEGYSLESFTSADDGLKYIYSNMDDVDLVLSDISLPDTPDNYYIPDQMSKISGHVPVVLLTSVGTLDPHGLPVIVKSNTMKEFLLGAVDKIKTEGRIQSDTVSSKLDKVINSLQKQAYE